MKTAILFTLVLALLPWSTIVAQGCLSGTNYFNQDSIDQFKINHPGCTEILGSLIISDTAVTALDSLYEVQSIGGDFSIRYTALTTLHGLESIDFIGGGLSIIQ